MASKVFGKSAVRAVFHFLLCCGLPTGIARCQSAQPQAANESPAEVADAIAKVKSGKFNGYHVEVIGEARAVVAIPDLEKQFTLVSEPLERAKIAQVLLLLGDKKDEYWDYLAGLMKPILDSDAPSPEGHDAQGKLIRPPSPEFVEWARKHGRSPGEAAEDAVYRLPGIVGIVGMTGDSRALPLLRRALLSPNFHIAFAAAFGLAEMQDTSSIPLIISRCKEAPAEASSLIAESLVYFDDPEGQKAVDRFIPKEKAKLLRDARSAGEGPLHAR
ncbi:MAG: hypothetical protein LAN64_09145 [Acidobacteriia bacterium]|nr:hypothetical protein [Terriglobia bacterium]